MSNILNILGITLHKQPQLLVKPGMDLVFPIISLYQKTLKIDQALPTSHQWIALTTRITLGIGFAYITHKTYDWIEKKGVSKARNFLDKKFRIKISPEFARNACSLSTYFCNLLFRFLGNSLDSKTTAYMEFVYNLSTTYHPLKNIITFIKHKQLPNFRDGFDTLSGLNRAHSFLFCSQVSEYAEQILKTMTPLSDPIDVAHSSLTHEQVADVVSITNQDRQLPLPKLLALISRSSAYMESVRHRAALPGFLTPLIESFAGTLAPRMVRLFGYTEV